MGIRLSINFATRNSSEQLNARTRTYSFCLNDLLKSSMLVKIFNFNTMYGGSRGCTTRRRKYPPNNTYHITCIYSIAEQLALSSPTGVVIRSLCKTNKTKHLLKCHIINSNVKSTHKYGQRHKPEHVRSE